MALWIGKDCLKKVPDGIRCVWGVVLEPLTAVAKCGDLQAVSDSRDELVHWVRSQEAPEPCMNDQLKRSYISGPLMSCKAPPTLDAPGDEYWGHGIIKLSLVHKWVRVE